jgi:hypothetical protein
VPQARLTYHRAIKKYLSSDKNIYCRVLYPSCDKQSA